MSFRGSTLPAYRFTFRNANFAGIRAQSTQSGRARPTTYANLNRDATRPCHAARSCAFRGATRSTRARVLRNGERVRKSLLPSASRARAGCSINLKSRKHGLPSQGWQPSCLLRYASGTSSVGLWISRAPRSHYSIGVCKVSVAASRSRSNRSIQSCSLFGIPCLSLRAPA